ncbi:MAG TPA: LysR family transcriptional regulator [Aliiroseovarius sp.]|nr:LysR family transcriptional regulator [Aliiroseovarius sp.]
MKEMLMDEMGAMKSYVSAVQSGSLSGAARARRLSQPAISQQITALETLYDTRLLQRGRNGVQMTEAGEIVYARALAILAERAQITADIEALEGKVAGQFSVTSNLACCQSILGEVIVKLAQEHSDLTVELRAEDRFLDLASEGIDLALWAESGGHGAGIVRKIATQKIIHVATPAYLDATLRPTTPDDLVKLDYIQYRDLDDQIAVPLTRAGKTVHAPLKTALTAQLPALVTQAIRGNLGFTKAAYSLVKDEIEAGILEEVLPDWHIADRDLFLVYPADAPLSLKSMAFLHALIDQLEATDGINLVDSARQHPFIAEKRL